MDYRSFYRELSSRLERETAVRTGTVLEGEHAGEKMFLPPQEKEESGEVMEETFLGKIHVVLCGGGHVSLAAAKILKLLDYELTVIDDREEFASIQRFSMADHVLCLNFEKDFAGVSFPAGAYYVILTRGHEHDYTCLENIMKRPYGYLGMIGSRSKVRQQKEKLLEAGFLQEQIDTVHAPIGLPIGGQTPEEIAVSIADHPGKKPFQPQRAGGSGEGGAGLSGSRNGGDGGGKGRFFPQRKRKPYGGDKVGKNLRHHRRRGYRIPGGPKSGTVV